MKRLLDLYCRALKWIAVLLLFIMVLLVFGNVVPRYASLVVQVGTRSRVRG